LSSNISSSLSVPNVFPISSNNFSNKLVKNGLYPEDAKQMTEMSDELLKKFNETKIPIRLAE
jgi:hypothetical protein